ncbi:MAG: hypothetical protein F6K54_01580 [Okeania sp. SIO3B5]|uniref:hypothetical protein n=1 Tax=Okeania sp. SIO3B5 TaxID=2607811 RepID=UPI0013FFC2AD|nr:hypothetical protein [Okeania sp. SIO3B5]NEO51893.1 hypothetical protein [Okeania sp. SIO3B5]
MTLAFTRERTSLRSRAARLRATNNQSVRRWSRTPSNSGGGIQNIFKNWGGKLVGWISGGLSALVKRLRSISVTQVFQMILSAGNLLLNFNWQVTDKQIESQIDAINKSIVERGFGAIGRTLGSTICGLGGAAVITKFNPALGYHVMSNVAPEVAEELLQEWSQALSQVGAQYSVARALEFYKGARKFLKDPNNPIGKVLRSLVGDETISKWGNPGNDEWSFKKGIGNVVKRVIKDEDMREALEEGWEEFSDACIEAGFIIAGSIDDWIGMQSYQREGLLGRERTIEVTPNKEVPEERFILTGNQSTIRTATTAIIAQQQLLNNRDVGTIVIDSSSEEVVTTSNGIEIVLEFFAYEQPPYWSNEREKKNARSRLTVPNCKKTKINWSEIKQLFGNNKKSHDKGDLAVEADLSNGKMLKAWVHTKQDGKTIIERMASLSEAELIRPFRYIEKDEYDPEGKLKPKEVRPQYLAHMHILNWDRKTKYETAVAGTKKKRKSARVEFYYETKPSWMDDKINELLKTT